MKVGNTISRTSRHFGEVEFKGKNLHIYAPNEYKEWNDVSINTGASFLTRKGKELFRKNPNIELSIYAWVNIEFDNEKRMFYAQMVLDDVVQDTKYYLGRKIKKSA